MNKQERKILDELKVSEDILQEKFSQINQQKTFDLIKQEAVSIIDKTEFPISSSNDGLALTMLYLFKNKLLHKDAISNIIRKYNGDGANDYQARHLSSQKGLHILNKGDPIPNTNLSCPSGWHMLISLDGVSPRYAVLKRKDLLQEGDFDNIKNMFGHRCAHCGSLENEKNFRDNSITTLQEGHIDPNIELAIGNIIPLCDYCNRTYKDKFIFATNGAIDNINIINQRISRLLVEKIAKTHGKWQIQQWLDI